MNTDTVRIQQKQKLGKRKPVIDGKTLSICISITK